MKAALLFCLAALPAAVDALGEFHAEELKTTCPTLVPLRLNQTNPAGSLILPLPALLGAGVSAGLLWVDHRRWVMSAWSSLPVIVGLAVTLVVHDALALRCKQCAQVHATRTPSPDARPVISV